MDHCSSLPSHSTSCQCRHMLDTQVTKSESELYEALESVKSLVVCVCAV